MSNGRPQPQPGPAPPQTFPDSPPPGDQCNGRYPAGQCTAGAAVMFPGVCAAPNLGNGGEWYGNAVNLGWPNSRQPVPGWLASFRTFLPYGDVGLITAVNPDGKTVRRHGANWHLDGKWSDDDVAISSVIGSFQPPGPFFGPRSRGQEKPAEATGARGLPCQFGWHTPEIPLPAGQKIGSQSICFDGVVGVAAWLAGLACGIVALAIAVRRPVERAGGRAAEVAGVATGQPEVVAAGAVVRARGQRPRRPRGLAGSGSVQEQETYRDIRSLGGGRSTYSPVQARRMAQAAGSGGTREERLRRALLSTQS